MASIRKASDAFKLLNGVVCLYKPAGISESRARQHVISNLCRDLNQLEQRPLDERVVIEGATNEPMRVKIVTDYSDHPLVIGPRYQPKFMRSNIATALQINTSGVMLMGLNKGTSIAMKVHHARLTRSFKVHGYLGKATDTFYKNGKVVEKVDYKHVSRTKMDRVVSYMQSMHQQKMFEMSGIDMTSQAGYELATMGPIRPGVNGFPVLYGIKCVYFKPPNFIIEVQSINEHENYLFRLIHDIGYQAKSAAYCSHVQCIRYGAFTLENALLQKHWKLPHIIDSIKDVSNILKSNVKLMEPESAALTSINAVS